MNRDIFMKHILSTAVDITPSGRISNELSPEEFAPVAEQFFAGILLQNNSSVTENLDIQSKKEYTNFYG